MRQPRQWHQIQFDLPNNAAGGKGKRRRTECLWRARKSGPSGQRNRFIHNLGGVAIRLDVGPCNNNIIQYNDVLGNYGAGIRAEICCHNSIELAGEERMMPGKLSHPLSRAALLAVLLASGAAPKSHAQQGAPTIPAKTEQQTDVAPAKTQEAAEITRMNTQEGAQIPLTNTQQGGKKTSASTPENSKRDPRPYAHKPDLENVAYGPHQRNVLDLWKAKSDRPTPLVVFFHPGGFSLGDKTWISPILVETCLKKGISVATANYRYSFQARWPAQMEDSARAIQFLRLHAQQWNLNPKAFAATGSSAGAGISVWLGFHDDLADSASTDPVKRQSTRLCVFGFTNGQTTYDPREIAGIIGEENARKMGRMALASLFGLQKDEDAMKAAAAYPLFEDSSGLKHVKRGDPPIFMFYSTSLKPLTPDTPHDEVMHNIRFGIALKERMDKLGIECVLRNVDDYPGEAKDRPAKYHRDMVDFFLKHFPSDALQAHAAAAERQ